MFNYRFAVVAPPSHREPLAYSMAPRTVPTFVSRFTNPRPPTQNGINIIDEATSEELHVITRRHGTLIFTCRSDSLGSKQSDSTDKS